MNVPEYAPTPWKHEAIEPHEPGKAHRLVAANGVVVCYVPIAADAILIERAVNASSQPSTPAAGEVESEPLLKVLQSRKWHVISQGRSLGEIQLADDACREIVRIVKRLTESLREQLAAVHEESGEGIIFNAIPA